MTVDFSQVTLRELLAFANGRSSPERADGLPYPVYGSNGIIGYSNEANADADTIIIGRVGSYCGSLQFSNEKCWVTDNAIRATAIGDNEARFLFYLLDDLHLNNWRSGSGQPLLNQEILGSIRAVVPEPSEQRVIASVLGALDDKIEQNRRTAQALERLARAIFRAWFVDFEPVKAKAAGATSFPSMPQRVFDALPARFVDSAIGPVPEGWDVKALDQCVHLTMGQSPSSEYYNKSGEGLPFHQGVTHYGFRFPEHRVFCTDGGREAQPQDILLSVRAPVGRINVADRRLILGRGLAGLRHRQDRQSFLLYQLFHVFAEEDAVGDGTIYKAVTKKFLSQMPMLSPPDEFGRAFDKTVKPMDALIAESEQESRKLAEMRDYLLPRLLSGAVRVEAGHG